MVLGALESWESHLLGECFSLLMWPVLVSQLNFEFWDITGPSIDLPFHLFLFWATFKYNFYPIVMYYNFYKFYIFFHAIPLRNEWTCPFLRHDVSKFSQSTRATLNVKNVQSHFKLRHQVASTPMSSSFLTPPPPPRGHPLPPSSTLANAHMWANPG